MFVYFENPTTFIKSKNSTEFYLEGKILSLYSRLDLEKKFSAKSIIFEGVQSRAIRGSGCFRLSQNYYKTTLLQAFQLCHSAWEMTTSAAVERVLARHRIPENLTSGWQTYRATPTMVRSRVPAYVAFRGVWIWKCGIKPGVLFDRCPVTSVQHRGHGSACSLHCNVSRWYTSGWTQATIWSALTQRDRKEGKGTRQTSNA